MTRKQNSDAFRAYARENGVDIGLESKVLAFLEDSPGSTIKQAVRWIGE